MIEVIGWRGDHMVLLDQRLLPEREELFACRSAVETAEAIRAMVVRGAPAIGVAAAMGLATEAVRTKTDDTAELLQALEDAGKLLEAARPTAVNLAWAVRRVLAVARALGGAPAETVREAVVAEARRMHEEDVQTNRGIGLNGRDLIEDGATVLTHCNAGALATAGYGTALGVVRAAVEQGKKIMVLADETRPFLQGARLTAWELKRDGIPVTVITDNMAAYVLRSEMVSAVVVGSDRIAMNGDVANKIGTYGVAILAQAHGVPFYVAAPVSTIDPELASGEAIPIEQRPPEEVSHVAGTRLVPEGVPVMNPAFDVTPARYVTAIVTERGVARPPYEESLAAMVRADGS